MDFYTRESTDAAFMNNWTFFSGIKIIQYEMR